MAWVRLADDFYRHPKLLRAGPLASWLWACGLGYANHYLTDGYLPAAAVRGLTDLDDPFRLAAKLVESGLWRVAEGGYQIHDYERYQPSADSIKAERAKNAERVAAWRERHGNAITPDVRNGVSPASPGPGPGPVKRNPAPAGTSPQPPPPAEGERPRRRRRDDGEDYQAMKDAHALAEPEPLMPPTDADRELWTTAAAQITDGMLQANVEKVAALELLGRGADGALRLRAPPWADAARFQGAVRAALVNAGDEAGGTAVIVTG